MTYAWYSSYIWGSVNCFDRKVCIGIHFPGVTDHSLAQCWWYRTPYVYALVGSVVAWLGVIVVNGLAMHVFLGMEKPVIDIWLPLNFKAFPMIRESFEVLIGKKVVLPGILTLSFSLSLSLSLSLSPLLSPQHHFLPLQRFQCPHWWQASSLQAFLCSEHVVSQSH